MVVTIFTDGSCKPNPGPGAWASIVQYAAGPDIELSGFDADTPNNRMELMGPISGLEHLPRISTEVVITSDSAYVIKGISGWVRGWKKNGWITKSRHPVLNRDLWERLDELNSRHMVRWKWVKGHAGNVGNERADFLAMTTLARQLGRTIPELPRNEAWKAQ